MTKYALLIGICYSGRLQLRGCHNDVINMRNWLVKSRSYDLTNIVTMTDSPMTREEKLRPSRANILEQIALVVAKLKGGDKLFFHYSGHGTYVRDFNADESDGHDECIVPMDDDHLIIDDELKALMVDKIPIGASLVCVFDSCHSGTVLDLKYLWSGGSTVKTEGKEAECKLSKNVVCISGSTDSTTSADAYINNQSQGAMTWSLLDVLTTSGVNWRYNELVTLMRGKLVAGSYTQVPQLCVGTRDLIKSKVDI